MRTLILTGILLTAACGFALVLRAADVATPATPATPPVPAKPSSAVPVPALAEMEETFEPGLKLTIQSAAGATDTRVDRLVALRVSDGAAPSPFVAPGPFKATWEGLLTLRIRDHYAFKATGAGALKVTIDDQVVLDVAGDDLSAKAGEMIRIKKGKSTFKAEYTSPDSGVAAVRLLWFGKSFIPETVPTTIFSHDAADKALRQQSRLRSGRELVANLRCLKCHVSDEEPERLAMRELAMDTPALEDVGSRLTQAWLAHWINNPHAMRPDTEMPRLFHAGGDALDQGARDIAAYLVESSARPQTAAGEGEVSEETVTRGARLFTRLGCVSCHVLPGQENPTETTTPRISLKYVKHKFQPGALKAFLQKPEAHYAWIRMPNFRLSDEEATALAGFLRSRTASDLAGDSSGDAARGKELFASVGCVNCHTAKIETTAKPPALAQLSDWTRGCMAGDDAAARGRAPAYSLTDEERAAIQALAATQFASLKRDTAAEFSERQIVALNCLSCHPRDRQDDTWSGLGAEIDALMKDFPAEPHDPHSEITGDQVRPPLTWTGEKLRPEWASAFISGTLDYKPRPWLAARMPGFPSRGKFLADGFAEAHGGAPTSIAPGAPDERLATIGKELAGRAGGFACVQCHAVGDQKAFAPFEAPAINFAHVSERLHREYYDRWVYNPQRVQPGTRMPQFADIEGKTALKNHFDGDARKQFDAIWHYLLQGEKIEPPKN